MEELTSLAQYGITGLAIALITLITYMVRTFTELMKNHIQHETDALTGLRVAITELVTWLKAQNK